MSPRQLFFLLVYLFTNLIYSTVFTLTICSLMWKGYVSGVFRQFNETLKSQHGVVSVEENSGDQSMTAAHQPGESPRAARGGSVGQYDRMQARILQEADRARNTVLECDNYVESLLSALESSLRQRRASLEAPHCRLHAQLPARFALRALRTSYDLYNTQVVNHLVEETKFVTGQVRSSLARFDTYKLSMLHSRWLAFPRWLEDASSGLHPPNATTPSPTPASTPAASGPGDRFARFIELSLAERISSWKERFRHG